MAGQTFTVGQKVWICTWSGDENTYRQGNVTSVSRSSTQVWVSWSDGEMASYTNTARSKLLSEDGVERIRQSELVARTRRELHDTINNARDYYGDAIARLWIVVRGDGNHNPEFLQRLQKTTKQLEAIISSLATPVATNQQEPSR